MTTSTLAPLSFPTLLASDCSHGMQVMQGLVAAVVPGVSGSRDTRRHWPSAMTALRQASKREDLVAVGDVPGLHIYVSDDTLASSRALVLSDLLGQMPVSGVLVSLPAPDQLLLLRLDAIAHLDSLPVLLHAHRIALQNAADPLIPHLLWTDGSAWEAVPTFRDHDGAHLEPGPQLRAALTRLASLGWSPVQAALG